MDGDLAPLKELDVLAREYDAILIVDEAHATGVFGTALHPGRGRGTAEGLDTKGWISLQGCGKALGVAGAIVCAPADIIDYLINAARPFIYSTAPPPFLAAVVQLALELVEENPKGGEGVLERAAFAHRLLTAQHPTSFVGSQIVPIALGEDERALRVARALQEAGFDVRAIRPPTVKRRAPRGCASRSTPRIARTTSRRWPPHFMRALRYETADCHRHRHRRQRKTMVAAMLKTLPRWTASIGSRCNLELTEDGKL